MEPFFCNLLIMASSFMAILVLVLMLGAYLWLRRISEMKDCPCAVDRRVVFLRRFLAIAIPFGVLLNAFNIYRMCKRNCSRVRAFSWIHIPQFVLFIFGILFVIFSFNYLHYLRASQCDCATSGKGDEILFAYTVLLTITYAMVGVIILSSTLFALYSLLIRYRQRRPLLPM